MRATELGSGVAVGTAVNVNKPSNGVGVSVELKNTKVFLFVVWSIMLKSDSEPPRPLVLACQLYVSPGRSSAFSVAENVTESNVMVRVGDGNVTFGAVGTEQPSKHVKEGVNESAWALGAAKHKAKTRQNTATIGLNRLGI
jgi:hypothetical protein